MEKESEIKTRKTRRGVEIMDWKRRGRKREQRKAFEGRRKQSKEKRDNKGARKGLERKRGLTE